FTNLDATAISDGPLAACLNATAERERDARSAHGRCASSRARQHRQSDCGNHLWKHGDHVLCGGGLLWSRGHKTHATCNPGGFACRSHRRNRFRDNLPWGAVGQKAVTRESYKRYSAIKCGQAVGATFVTLLRIKRSLRH